MGTGYEIRYYLQHYKSLCHFTSKKSKNLTQSLATICSRAWLCYSAIEIGHRLQVHDG